MNKINSLALIFGVTTTLMGGLLPTLAQAQGSAAGAWPTKSVKLIIPFPPGGSTDIVGRIAAERMSRELGQPVVIENRGGAGGAIGAEMIARAAPDGYTLGIATVSTHGVLPVVNPKLSYDALRDFIPVTNLAAVPNVLAVHPGVKAANMKELLALLRANPGKMSYASSGTGGIGHLMGETFKASTKTFIVHVPYRGAAPAVTDAMAGQVEMIFDNLPSSLQAVRSGKLRGIAVAAQQRFPALPDVPTYAELGMPECNGMAWYGLVYPAKTPDMYVQRVHAAAVRALADPAVRDKLREQAAFAVGNTPAQFAEEIRKEIETNRRVVKEQGIVMTE